MSNPADLSIAEAAHELAARRLSVSDLVEACLARIAVADPEFNAFIHVMDDEARRDAARLDVERESSGPHGPLHGVPLAIKDIINVEGQATTAHSAIGVTARAARDAASVRRLRAAGAIIIGKTALHEFATGGPSFDLPWPPARNPWRSTHHPGGSSTGSAVAVATGMAPGALGTDTAGSVRHPATACGIVGLKPTYGAISVDGVFPLSATLDHVGVMARTVRDCALLYEAVRGQGETVSDSFALPRFDGDLSGTRIGVLEEFGREADTEIGEAVDAALATLERLGAELVAVRDLPPLSDFTACGQMILRHESHAMHAEWLRTRPDDYGARSRAKLLRGAGMDPAFYDHALARRRALSRALAESLKGLDAAVSVSSFHLPCAIDDDAEVDRTYDRQARTPFNLTGAPAVAVPVGFSRSGLPIGMQIAGVDFAEPAILRVAHAYEHATPWHRMRPPLPHAPTSTPKGTA